MIDTASLVAAIRLKSGLKNNQYFKDADLAGFASDGAAELFDLIVKANEHYFRRDFDFTLVGGVGGNTVKRPLDFYKEQILELDPDAPYPSTVPMLGDLGAKNLGGAMSVLTNGQPARQWIMTGDTIEILPAPSAAGVYRMRYTPILEKLVLPNQIDLTTAYAPFRAPDVTARLYLSQAIVPAGGTAFFSADTLTITAPDTALPIVIDGVVPNIGDIILFPKDTAPGAGGGNLDPLNEGLWVYQGVSETGATLVYVFTRLTGYVTGNVISMGRRVAISDGVGFKGTIWYNDSNWTVQTNTTNWLLSVLEAPITVRAMTTSVMTGTWFNSNGGNTLSGFLSILPQPDGLKIDGEDLSVGDLIFIDEPDAPVMGTNWGIWQYMGLTNVTTYVFQRPAGLLVNTLTSDVIHLSIIDGATRRGVTLIMPQTIIGVSEEGTGVVALNSLSSAGLALLQNAELDPSYVGGTMAIEGSPLGDRTYTITGYVDETSVTVATTDGSAIVAEQFGAPTLIHVTRLAERYTIPQEMLPWQDFIVIHASIAVQQGRQQSSAALERKLEALKTRIAGMTVNRSEDVIQAPITKHLRRGAGWGPIGGTGGSW